MRRAGFLLTSTIIILFAWLANREVRVAIVPGDGETLAKLAALLESQLSQRSGVAVVERTAVAAILREQKLQAMFAAESVRSRIDLGKLLKADLLVMLRTAVAPEKGLELIACDTSQGLRLCVERIPVSGNASVDVAELQKIVSQALLKRAESITQIIAVPPLVSNDLGLGAQMLQRPLAKIVEQALLQRPGIVVVEMAEAKALATEIALTSSNGIDRKMPFYVMGEYRYDSSAQDSPMTFQLRLLRGEKQIGSRASSGMKKADAATALPRRVLELLDEANGPSAGTNILTPNASDEAAQLARRAETMYRVESWTEATDLAEASLLLKPNQPTLHRLAADALQLEARRLKEALPAPALTVDALAEKTRHVQTLFAQGLPHLEAFMTTAAFAMKKDFVVLSPYLRRCTDHAALRTIMLRVLAAKQAAGISDEMVRTCSEWASTSCAELSLDDLDRWKLDAARAWPGASDPDGRYLARFMVARADLGDHGKIEWLARSLSDLDTPEASQAAEKIMRMSTDLTAKLSAKTDARQSSGTKAGDSPDTTAPGTTVPGMTAIVRRHPVPVQIWGAASAGSSLDVAWGKNLLYPWPNDPSSKLRPMLHIAMDPSGTPVCYDGKFIWAYCTPTNDAQSVTQRSRSASLVAIDPQTKHVTFLGVESGLPSDQLRAANITPIAPGKVCVVGHFGPSVGGRVWITMATLDNVDHGMIKVFHEARDFNSGASADWKNSHLAFNFSRAFTLRSTSLGRTIKTAVVVERSAMAHPLLIDPETLNVTVVNEAVCGAYPSQLVEHDGALYWLGKSDRGYRFCRWALPDLKVEFGKELFATSGNLFFYKQRAGMIRDGHLWQGDDPMGMFHAVPLHIEPEARGFSPAHMLGSETHGLLFSNFGEVDELVLP